MLVFFEDKHCFGAKKLYFVYVFIFVMIIHDRPSCLKGTKTKATMSRPGLSGNNLLICVREKTSIDIVCLAIFLAALYLGNVNVIQEGSLTVVQTGKITLFSLIRWPFTSLAHPKIRKDLILESEVL